MFDPPYGRIAIAGTPILRIPKSEKTYRNFLQWWFEAGRQKPNDPQGWSTLSGPWVMKNRVEAIPAEEWKALPASEQDLIQAWAECLPIDLFYD